MSDDSKSFEKKLDRDFLYYLSLTKEYFGNVKEESDQQLCEAWLTHLFGKTLSTLAEKSDRNIYLSRLLLQMQNGKLVGVFKESPPNGPLPCAFTTFGLPTEVDGLKGFEEMGFQIDSSIGGGSGDFFESSRDGRTYLATRRIPQGIMAYMAVTNNEGEPVWIPQTCPSTSKGQSALAEAKGICEKNADTYTKKLLEFIEVPLCQLRKSPEDRERVLEWMDKIINDCNKWIQGEDPLNKELEQLFKQLYEEYKKDPENAELLKHPQVRNILFQDIRDKIAERRAEVTKREMILDQYEAEQYTETLNPEMYIDEVWLECAKKPVSDSTKYLLEDTYPQEIIQRFNDLLFQERLMIIQKGEQRAKKKIAELRKTSIEDTKKELQRLKRVHDEYKDFYCIYKDIEEKYMEFEKEAKSKCAKGEKGADQQATEKYKQDILMQIQQAKRNFEKESKAGRDLREKLEEAKEAYRRVKDRMAAEEEKLKCEFKELYNQKMELEEQICTLKTKKEELKCKMAAKKTQCRQK